VPSFEAIGISSPMDIADGVRLSFGGVKKAGLSFFQAFVTISDCLFAIIEAHSSLSISRFKIVTITYFPVLVQSSPPRFWISSISLSDLRPTKQSAFDVRNARVFMPLPLPSGPIASTNSVVLGHHA